MEKAIKIHGGRVLTDSEVTGVTKEKKQYEVQYLKEGKKKKIVGTHIVSSIPLPLLCQQFHPTVEGQVSGAASNLKYLSVLVVNILLDREKVNDASWIYYPESDIIFNYILEFKNWSIRMVKKGKTSLSANITCKPNDAIWQLKDKELMHRVCDDLIRTGLINKKEISGGFVCRLPYAYPVYDLSYRKNLNIIRAYFSSLPHMYLVGRTGNFEYANSDKVMEEGMKIANKIILSL